MTDDERRTIIKAARLGIQNLVNVLYPAREGDRAVALALTKLEEADLWLFKAAWHGVLPPYADDQR